MNGQNRIYCKDRKEWRIWLQKNYLSQKCVWLVYYKKHTKKLSIYYNDAVEEAICFGWIDSQIKKIDDERYMPRYTPRTSKSHWSVVNIERANRMIDQGQMTSEGLKIYKYGVKNQEIIPSSKSFTVPVDLEKALAKNGIALNNFQNFSPSDQLAYAYWVHSAKKNETRQRRIEETVKLLRKNKKFKEK